MTTLVDFLQARLTEIETVANAAVEITPGQAAEWTSEYAPFCDEPYWTIGTKHGTDHIVQGGYEGGGTETEENANHIAFHDPKHELRMVDALRRILTEHTCTDDCEYCRACSGDYGADPTLAPCQTIRLMALPFDQHPDFDESWRL